MNLNNQPRMVLIDLDGTLVDSVPDLAYCVDEMMLALGLPIRGELPVRMALYKDNVSKRSQLYPGVKEGLDFLRGAGYKLGCITNKAAAFTEPLLQDLGVYDYFEIVVSGDTLPVKKPDPAPLLHAATFFGVPASEALMVGDSI